jgi:hypothetical protein
MVCIKYIYCTIRFICFGHIKLKASILFSCRESDIREPYPGISGQIIVVSLHVFRSFASTSFKAPLYSCASIKPRRHKATACKIYCAERGTEPAPAQRK